MRAICASTAKSASPTICVSPKPAAALLVGGWHLNKGGYLALAEAICAGEPAPPARKPLREHPDVKRVVQYLHSVGFMYDAAALERALDGESAKT